MAAKIKKWYSGLRLYPALLFTFHVIFLLAIVALVTTMALVTGKMAETNYSRYTTQFLQGFSNNLEHLANDIETISLYILSDENIQKMMECGTESRDYENLILAAQEDVIRLTMEKDYIESCSVYNFDGIGFSSGNSPSYICDPDVWKSQEWYPQMIEKKGKYIWTNAKFSGIYGEERRVVFGRVINRTDTQNAIGGMLFVLKNAYLEEMVTELHSPSIGDFYIFDDHGEMLCGAETEEATQAMLIRAVQEKSGLGESVRYENGYVTNFEMTHLNWNLLCVGQTSMVLGSLWINLLIILVVTMLVVLIASYIYRGLSRSITKEISRLNEVMGRAEEQNFKEEIAIKRVYEFIQLGDAYNRMTKRINVLLNQVMQEKVNTKQAQLETLQAQINPHFLYNTLNCISWKAMANDQTEISEMIQGLSRMFRFSLGKGEQTIELEKEIDNIRDYLMLQKKRFEDKLVYLIDVEEEVFKYRVIRFFLQPLVENSILHGIAKQEGKGYIGITAEEREGVLFIQVWDNGVGFDEEKVAKLLNGDTYVAEQKRHKHGIYNVNERLKMSYGPESALRFEKRKNGGTKVTIRIPVEKLK